MASGQSVAAERRDARNSSETERRHLLAETASIAPSESASQAGCMFDDGERTPRAGSPIASATGAESRRATIASDDDPTAQPYRGFASQAHYLAALEAWAESKKFLELDTSLVGYYGQNTSQDYCKQAPPELGIRKMFRERRAKREAARQARRNTVV